MKLPPELRYTETHEWVRREADGTLSVGITDHAQEQLGDIVFLELPETGRMVAKGESVGVVESVKAASDIYAPVAGEIVAANAELSTAPEKVNEDPYNQGWLIKLKLSTPDQVGKLMTAAEYTAYVGAET